MICGKDAADTPIQIKMHAKTPYYYMDKLQSLTSIYWLEFGRMQPVNQLKFGERTGNLARI